jgi:preprotein translocase subunit SecD
MAARAVPKRVKKAGLSGLLLCGLLACAASAEPLAIEIVRAELGIDERTGMSVVIVRLNEASKRLLAEASQKNLGKRMDLRVDGRVVMSPYIREPLLGGSFQITALSVEEARDVTERISAGGAKVEIEIVKD